MASSDEPSAARESVWDYPRPPRVERADRRIRVLHRGVVVADSRQAWRVLETSHPPVYYLPADDIRMDLLEPVEGRSSYCEWKGTAAYFDVVVEGERVVRAAFTYPDPAYAFGPIAGHVAFYASAVDRCLVDDEVARPQPGGFYAGWITDDLEGPFKGESGTRHW